MGFLSVLLQSKDTFSRLKVFGNTDQTFASLPLRLFSNNYSVQTGSIAHYTAHMSVNTCILLLWAPWYFPEFAQLQNNSLQQVSAASCVKTPTWFDLSASDKAAKVEKDDQIFLRRWCMRHKRVRRSGFVMCLGWHFLHKYSFLPKPTHTGLP